MFLALVLSTLCWDPLVLDCLLGPEHVTSYRLRARLLTPVYTTCLDDEGNPYECVSTYTRRWVDFGTAVDATPGPSGVCTGQDATSEPWRLPDPAPGEVLLFPWPGNPADPAVIAIDWAGNRGDLCQ